MSGRHEKDAAMTDNPKGATPAEPLTDEALRKAMARVWSLGQTYLQQADSDYPSQNKKSDATREKYLALVDETAAALATPAPAADTPLTVDHLPGTSGDSLEDGIARTGVVLINGQRCMRPVIRVACISLHGSTLTVPVSELSQHAETLDDGDSAAYTLTFKTMAVRDYEALGDFNGF